MLVELTPVVEIVVGIRQFHNVDLHLRGYYHIRAKMKATSTKYGSVKTEIQVPRSNAPHVFPASVVDGYAVGKTIEILYAEESVVLDDTFHFTLRMSQRIDKIPQWMSLTLLLELWYCEKDQMLKKSNKDLLDGFRCLSEKSLQIRMSLRQGLHYFRPVLFDYSNLAAITLVLNASLVDLEKKISKKKTKNADGPDTPSTRRKSMTPVPEKLKVYHRTACHYLLSAYESLQLKTKNFARLLPPKYQIRIQMVDTVGKLDALCRRLSEESDPWLALDEDRQLLAQELNVLWHQFLDLFAGRVQIEQTLAFEQHNARVKRFAEGFFLTEDTLHGLIASSYSSSGQSLNFYTRLVDLLKRSPYFCQLPQLPVASAEMDGDSESMPVIFEEKYIHPLLSRTGTRLPSTSSGGEGRRRSSPHKTEHHRLSPEKVVRALKTSLCLDLTHRHRPASTSSVEEPTHGNDLLNGMTKDDDYPPLVDHETIVLTEMKEVDCWIASPSSPLWASVSGWAKIGRSCSCPNLVCDRERESVFLESVAGRAKSDGNIVLSPHLLSSPATLSCPVVRKEEKASPLRTESGLCCLPLCGAASPLCSKGKGLDKKKDTGDSSGDGSTPLLGPSDSFTGAQLTAAVDESVLEFVRSKEHFKERLSLAGYNGHLYSDFVRFASTIPSYVSDFPSREDSTCVHLIICVHGLDGCNIDLRPYKTFLRYGIPNEPLDFLMSEANQNETFNDFETMTKNFVDEILLHLSRFRVQPSRISFIGHSLGTIIIRSALCDPRLEGLLDRLHCFLSLNGPHCGVLFNQKAVNWGMSFVQWWKNSKSLQQLALRDKPPESLRETFLYNLSLQSGLAAFKYVLLVGSNQDMYVPCHSALIQTCKAAQRDSGLLGVVYGEMVSNLLESVTGSQKRTTVVRYTAFHGLAGISRTHQVLGRAAHIAVLDDDLFIEKLLIVSALQYFA